MDGVINLIWIMTLKDSHSHRPYKSSHVNQHQILDRERVHVCRDMTVSHVSVLRTGSIR
jgi:hypothetical protein